jgi:hypothetical protein
MDTIKLIAIADLQVGIIMFFINLPLVFRQVPMNKAYGIRLRAAFESEQRWYDINAYGGRLFAIWSSLLIAAGVTGFFVPAADFDTYAYGSLGAATLAVTIPLVLTLRWSGRPASLNKSDAPR